MAQFPALRQSLLAGAVAAATSFLISTAAAQPVDVSVQRVWQNAHADSGVDGQKAEIPAHDDRTDTLWVAGVVGIDVLDRAAGRQIAHISVTNFGAVNTVAIHNGLAALAIENGVDRTLPGAVAFYDTRSRRQLGDPVTAGALPDMPTFTPNGRQVLVANEGTPDPRAAAMPIRPDPPGSVSIIDVHSRQVKSLPIDASIPGFDTLRLFPERGTLPTQQAAYSPYDPEPEYIAVDKTGEFAYVGLQEANGIAVLNLQTQAFEGIYNLGLKDFSLPGNEIDPNDQDGRIELRAAAVKGLYQPDTIATCEHKGRTYLVMANEGDARENGSTDGADERLGRERDHRVCAGRLGARPPGDVERRLGPRRPAGQVRRPFVLDPRHRRQDRLRQRQPARPRGDPSRHLRRRAQRQQRGRAEGVALLHAEGRVLAFIGLERTTTAAFAVYDITDPADVRYVDMIVSPGDRSPEGLAAFRAGPRYFVAVADEVSDTTSLFEVDVRKGPGLGRSQ
ncbi:MAG: choice-of-anchor I domain-containing protein [Betaproteobacteria bacterium]